MKNIVLVNGLRVFKPSGAISAVLREQKTERAMKAIMLLNGMRQKFSMGGNGGESCDNLSAEDLMKDITTFETEENKIIVIQKKIILPSCQEIGE